MTVQDCNEKDIRADVNVPNEIKKKNLSEVANKGRRALAHIVRIAATN
jgi:hypothetical protein